MTKRTIKQINAVVQSTVDKNLTLYKGEYYFYFVFDDDKLYETKSVYVATLNSLTEADWLEEARDFFATL